jgi:hypothetical protein
MWVIHMFPQGAELKAKNHEIEKFQLRGFLTKDRLFQWFMSQFASLPPKSASRSYSDETSGSRTGRRQTGADPIGSRERYLEEGRGREAVG